MMTPLDENIKMEAEQTIKGEFNWLNLFGFLKRVEEVPSAKPRNIYEQIVIVTNGGSTRAYIYENYSLAWKYIALT